MRPLILCFVLAAACVPALDDDGEPTPADDDTTGDDDDATGDDDTTGDDDDATGDDDTSGDDDTTGDDDSVDPPPVGDCVVPSARSHHEVVVADGIVEFDLHFSIDAGVIAPTSSITYNFSITNVGAVDFGATWDNCGFPTFSLSTLDGEELWRQSEGDQIACLVPGTTLLSPGQQANWTWSGPADAGSGFAGFANVAALATLALHGPSGGPEDGPTGWQGSPLQISMPMTVTDFVGACAEPGATATFGNGLELNIESAATYLHVGEPATVAGGATPLADPVVGPWTNCGWPEFALMDPTSVEVWRWSDAYVADCKLAEEIDSGGSAWSEVQIPAEHVSMGGVYRAAVEFRTVALGGDGLSTWLDVAMQTPPWDAKDDPDAP